MENNSLNSELNDENSQGKPSDLTEKHHSQTENMEKDDKKDVASNSKLTEKKPKSKPPVVDEIKDVAVSKDDDGILLVETSEADEKPKDSRVAKRDDEITATPGKEEKEETQTIVIDEVNHEKLDKNQLVTRLNYLLQNIPASSGELKSEVDAIKSHFYKKHKQEVLEIKARFLEEGGVEEDFRVVPDPSEVLIKELLQDYKAKRSDILENKERSKAQNLATKYEIIEEIKALQLGEESLNKTFKTFRDLQDRWRETGSVPQSEMKNLYETYHHHVELFYDYIKINKELRDLDLKKNFDAKTKLCERAETLVDAENVIDAFAELQDLHHEWREIGPVRKEDKDALWERFREATSTINKKHQQHYEDIKGDQKENLEKKTLLCEKVEDLCKAELDKPKDWNKKSDEILQIQAEWRTIGFAPKKYNAKIYERFRAACDEFFNKKRDFYQNYKEVQEKNYEDKLKLIEIAESLKDSTNWKEDSDTMIKIQKDWKSIGPVPRKNSDAIWKRFRAACDQFFKRKTAYFKNIDSVYEDNLTNKKKLIEEIKAYKVGSDNKATLKQLDDFKQRWNELGHVPFKDKDTVYNDFRNALNQHYDHLQMDDVHKEVEKFRSKVDDIQNSSNSQDKASSERLRLYNKLKKLESEISVWENNIGFFSSSKNSDKLLKEFQQKIDDAKERKEVIVQKIKIIDSM